LPIDIDIKLTRLLRPAIACKADFGIYHAAQHAASYTAYTT